MCNVKNGFYPRKQQTGSYAKQLETVQKLVSASFRIICRESKQDKLNNTR